VSNGTVVYERYKKTKGNDMVTEMMARVDDLPALEHLRQTVQRHRIQMGNRLSAVEAGRTQMDASTAAYFMQRFTEIETDCMTLISRAVEGHVMWPWLSAVKGIGPGLAGAVLAPIDIGRANTVSALWRYAGQGVTDGERDRPKKGERLNYNANLKRTMFLVASSFMRSGSPYRREYDESKAYYQRGRDWTPKHIDMAAKRKMVKLFLSHLWTQWRYIELLPLRSPYAIQVLSHDGMKPPWDYVPDFEYHRELREFYRTGEAEGLYGA
jgi:hypothetical protein